MGDLKENGFGRHRRRFRDGDIGNDFHLTDIYFIFRARFCDLLALERTPPTKFFASGCELHILWVVGLAFLRSYFFLKRG